MLCSQLLPSRDLQLNSVQKAPLSLSSFLAGFKAASKFQPNPAWSCQESWPAARTCRFGTHPTARTAAVVRVMMMMARRSSPPCPLPGRSRHPALGAAAGRAIRAVVLPPLHHCLFTDQRNLSTPDPLNFTHLSSL